MSDQELVKLYKSTGTGSGSGATIRTVITNDGNGALTPVPASEVEVAESKQSLNSLAISLAFTLVMAAGQFFEAAAPALAQLLLQYLPQVPFVSTNLLVGLVLSIAAWMQKRAGSKHKIAVVKALVTEPSEELKAAYERQKKVI